MGVVRPPLYVLYSTLLLQPGSRQCEAIHTLQVKNCGVCGHVPRQSIHLHGCTVRHRVYRMDRARASG